MTLQVNPSLQPNSHLLSVHQYKLLVSRTFLEQKSSGSMSLNHKTSWYRESRWRKASPSDRSELSLFQITQPRKQINTELCNFSEPLFMDLSHHRTSLTGFISAKSLKAVNIRGALASFRVSLPVSVESRSLLKWAWGEVILAQLLFTGSIYGWNDRLQNPESACKLPRKKQAQSCFFLHRHTFRSTMMNN